MLPKTISGVGERNSGQLFDYDGGEVSVAGNRRPQANAGSRLRANRQRKWGVIVKLILAAARALASLPLFLTLLPLTRSGRGLVRIWDFPRMQIAGAAAIAAASLKYCSRWKKADRFLIVSLSLAAAYQLGRIFPYTPLHRKQMRGTNPADRVSLRCIRLVIANVYMHNRQFDLMRQVIEEADADVICLVEPGGKWQASMER